MLEINSAKYTPRCILHDLNLKIKCSREKEPVSLMLCRQHLHMFHMNVVHERLISGFNRNEVEFDQLVFTKTPTLFLTFPYDLENNKWCYNHQIFENHRQDVSFDQDYLILKSFLVNGRINSTDAFQPENYALNTNYVSSLETRDLFELNRRVIQFLLFKQQQLQARFNNIQISAITKDENNIEQEKLLPMKELPLFYLALFYNVQFSTVCFKENLANPQATRVSTVQPNLILDLDNHYFKIINNTERKPLFVHTDTSTFASRVILHGQKITSTDMHIPDILANSSKLFSTTMLPNNFCASSF